MKNKKRPDDTINLNEVEDIYSQNYHITGELSRGGQGVVLKTKDPQILIKIALKNDKLVQDTSGNEQYTKLRFLPIAANEHVTLPLATLKNYEGYVMRMLRDMETFREHFAVFRTPDELRTTPWIESAGDAKETFANHYTTGGTRRRLEAFLKSGSLLAQLHTKGLVYCDYSLNNAFISKDHDYCNVWLIDADNLKPEKETLVSYLYTPGIAAPEIMLFADELSQGIAEKNCVGKGNSFSSDTYTFAYCLFKEITFCDPFEGEAFNYDLDNCDGREAVDAKKDAGEYSYIDDQNRDNENSFFNDIVSFAISDELRELFNQTFDAQRGKSWRWLRPSMPEYCRGTAKALDTVLHCKACGMDFFRNGNKKHTCPWCDSKLGPIVRLKSFYYEGNKKQAPIWYYERELEHTIEIPLRLLHGYVAEELDDICLGFKQESNKFKVELKGSNSLQLSYSKDGVNFEKCNSAEIGSNRFYLRLVDFSRNTEIYVMGEVEQ